MSTAEIDWCITQEMPPAVTLPHLHPQKLYAAIIQGGPIHCPFSFLGMNLLKGDFTHYPL